MSTMRTIEVMIALDKSGKIDEILDILGVANKQKYIQMVDTALLKRKSYFQEYRQKNSEKINQRARDYIKAHRQKRNENARRYYEKNRELVNERSRAYKERNREKINARRRELRALKKEQQNNDTTV